MTDEHILRGLEQDAQFIEERMPEKMTQQAIMDVALRVKDLLGKEGWSLRQIAEMVGVSRSAKIGRASCRERV